ncbi:putative flavoprotein involved in K+ transport [Seinonella peptonophila]|uniref:Putative flavoprotein involved in K+ transport n=1 Tax=Seinonella peptonophila TaxID=112248 RepID=A0A1M4T2V4_9BACL|nr:putative flavoprotein involved in K+ transport [Seinonella peptonophila]
MEKFEVVIIGAGQAGLAMGYFLKQENISFVLLDAQKSVGESWRNRYDSLVLFTPKRYSGLPGFPFPGDPNSFPTKDETTDYLESYANHFLIPIHLSKKVTSLTKKNNHFLISTDQDTYQANKVIVAAGPFQKPLIPAMAQKLSPHIKQIHSSNYRNVQQLMEGNVLVVGGGNSGAQIAVELAHHKQTFHSVSYPIEFMPLQFLGKSIFWYYEKLGLLQADNSTIKGKWIQQQKEKVYGFELKKLLKNGDIIRKPRLISITQGSRAVFADQTSIEIQNILWATGFSLDSY